MEHVLFGVQSFNRRLHLLLKLHTQPFEAARTRDNVKWEKNSRDANNKATRPFYLYSRRHAYVLKKRERARASWASERIRFVDKSDQTDYRSGECNRVKVDVYIQRLCLRTFHILVGCESRRNSNQSNSKLQTRSMNCFYTWNIDFWDTFSLLNLVNSIKFHQYQRIQFNFLV